MFSSAKTIHTEEGKRPAINSNRLNTTCKSTLSVAKKTKRLKTNERKKEGLLGGKKTWL